MLEATPDGLEHISKYSEKTEKITCKEATYKLKLHRRPEFTASISKPKVKRNIGLSWSAFGKASNILKALYLLAITELFLAMRFLCQGIWIKNIN